MRERICERTSAVKSTCQELCAHAMLSPSPHAICSLALSSRSLLTCLSAHTLGARARACTCAYRHRLQRLRTPLRADHSTATPTKPGAPAAQQPVATSASLPARCTYGRSGMPTAVTIAAAAAPTVAKAAATATDALATAAHAAATCSAAATLAAAAAAAALAAATATIATAIAAAAALAAVPAVGAG